MDVFFKIRFRIHPESEPLYRQSQCVYVCNHRSFADFFIDGYLTDNSAYIGRWMAAIAAPLSAIVGIYRGKVGTV